MLFLIIVLLAITAASCIVIYKKSKVNEWCFILGFVLSFIAAFGLLFSLGAFGSNYLGIDAKVASMNKHYESLVWQHENDIYDNDNDYGKRELMLDIQEWNEDLAKKRELQDNFWVGIYYPDIYDQFNFVEYGGSAE